MPEVLLPTPPTATWQAMMWAPTDGTVVCVCGLDRVERFAVWTLGNYRPREVELNLSYYAPFGIVAHDAWIDVATGSPVAPVKWRPATDAETDGWRGIGSAPTRGEWIEVKTFAGGICRAHWAQGGGDDQPRYRGWFGQHTGGSGGYYPSVDYPLLWRPLAKTQEVAS